MLLLQLDILALHLRSDALYYGIYHQNTSMNNCETSHGRGTQSVPRPVGSHHRAFGHDFEGTKINILDITAAQKLIDFNLDGQDFS